MNYTTTVTPHGGFETKLNMENNKLIAEFMGFVESPTTDKYWTKRSSEGFGIGELVDLKFHTDWNWLMPVVEKIENTKYFDKEIQFSITKYAISIQSINKNGVVISPCIFSKQGTFAGTEKRNAIYIACVEFIKWYFKND